MLKISALAYFTVYILCLNKNTPVFLSGESHGAWQGTVFWVAKKKRKKKIFLKISFLVFQIHKNERFSFI